MEHAVLTAKDDVIHLYNLPPALRPTGFADEVLEGDERLSLARQLALVERHILENAVQRHNGNRAAAGRELGLSPRMMNYRLKKAGIQ